MIPETRGRTSATRVGEMRPGNSRIWDRARGCMTTTLTSGSDAADTVVAVAVDSLHPASIGDNTASINAMLADRARKPDILIQSPLLNFETRILSRVADVVVVSIARR